MTQTPRNGAQSPSAPAATMTPCWPGSRRSWMWSKLARSERIHSEACLKYWAGVIKSKINLLCVCLCAGSKQNPRLAENHQELLSGFHYSQSWGGIWLFSTFLFPVGPVHATALYCRPLKRQWVENISQTLQEILQINKLPNALRAVRCFHPAHLHENTPFRDWKHLIEMTISGFQVWK